MLDEKTLKLYGTVDVAGAGICPTVEIASPESPSGRITINEADFDSGTMKLYFEETEPKRQSRR